jgi:hypothetical protein
MQAATSNAAAANRLKRCDIASPFLKGIKLDRKRITFAEKARYRF